MKFHQQSEGWTYDEYPEHEFTCIQRPREIGGGSVSINFKRRAFSFGHGPVYKPHSIKKYTGRGWRDALIADACDALEKAMS